MDKDKIIYLLGLKQFKKLTGPPEHWLTTFNTKFWGLELKHERRWQDIQVGDLFIFHSTRIGYLSHKPKIPTGIIGLGIVGAINRKTNFEWIGEIQNKHNKWPLLIHFSEIWWFGDYDGITNENIRQKIGKGENAIINDLYKLVDNCITFADMRESGFSIPARGSIQNIRDSSKSKLLLIISDMLKEAVENPIEVTDKSKPIVYPINNDDDIITHLVRQTPLLRDINLDESEEAARDRERKQISYEQNWKAQENANISHRKMIKLVADEIRKHGIQPKESDIDVLAEKDGTIFIFEIKSIHTENFRRQTRSAIGQLLDYEYFQVKSKPENYSKQTLRGVVYNLRPPEEFIKFLKTYGFNVFWQEEEKLVGDVESIKVFKEFVS